MWGSCGETTENKRKIKEEEKERLVYTRKRQIREREIKDLSQWNAIKKKNRKNVKYRGKNELG